MCVALTEKQWQALFSSFKVVTPSTNRPPDLENKQLQPGATSGLLHQPKELVAV